MNYFIIKLADPKLIFISLLSGIKHCLDPILRHRSYKKKTILNRSTYFGGVLSAVIKKLVRPADPAKQRFFTDNFITISQAVSWEFGNKYETLEIYILKTIINSA